MEVETSIIDQLNSLYSKWFSNEQDSYYVAISNFEYVRGRTTHGDVEEKYKSLFSEILSVQYTLMDTPDTRSDSSEGMHMMHDSDISLKVRKIQEQIFYSRNLLQSLIRTEQNRDSDYDSLLVDDGAFMQFVPRDMDDMNELQQFFIYLIDIIRRNNYARYRKDRIYERRMVELPNGHFVNSYSWKDVKSIEDFVWQSVIMDENWKQFKNMTNGRQNIKAAIDFLTNANIYGFPDLEKDRRFFSFNNGVYMANTNVFIEYSDSTIATRIPSSPVPVAAKFFDLYFDPRWATATDWYSNSCIETSTFMKISEYQFKDPYDDDSNSKSREIISILMALLGRCLYNVGECDRWEVYAFIMGLAGTGKSKFCTVVQNFYDVDDVATISNDIEKRFGLEPVYGKLLAVAPEVKNDFGIPQAAFQSMLSGESVSVARKNKQALRVPEWKTTFFAVGNNIPTVLSDNAGSMSRRTVMFECLHVVTHVDTTLEKRLSAEMAAILVKCNRAYHWLLEKCGSQGLWENLPDYFKETQRHLQANTNALVNYLQANHLIRTKPVSPEVIHKGAPYPLEHMVYVPEAVFKLNFFQFCDQNAISKPSWKNDYYYGPFAMFRLQRVMARTSELPYPRDSNTNVSFVDTHDNQPPRFPLTENNVGIQHQNQNHIQNQGGGGSRNFQCYIVGCDLY